MTTALEYDSLAHIVRSRTMSGGVAILDLQYGRDTIGRVTTLTEVRSGQTNTFGYSYDAIGQLTDARRNGVAVAAYVYDANGNRISVVTSMGASAATFDAQDRLIRDGDLTFGSTASGFVTLRAMGADTTHFTYGASGEILNVTLPSGQRIDYVVDGTHRRVGRRVNGVLASTYLYAAESIVAETDSTGSIVNRYVYASDRHVPDYLIRAGQAYRIIRDQIGSVRLVVNASTGIVAQQIDYDEFGRVVTDTRPGFQIFGYAGGIYDPATQLVRLGARDYDAAEGRWMSKDPTLFLGGDANLFRYAGNSPLMVRDPTGLCDGCSLIGESMAITMGGTLMANQLLGRPLLQDVVRNTAVVGLAAYAAVVAVPTLLSLPEWGFAATGSGATTVILGKLTDISEYERQAGDVILKVPDEIFSGLNYANGKVIKWGFIRYWQLRGADFKVVSDVSQGNLYSPQMNGIETFLGAELRWLLFESPGFNLTRVQY